MFAKGDGPQGRGYNGDDPIAARPTVAPYHPPVYLTSDQRRNLLATNLPKLG